MINLIKEGGVITEISNGIATISFNHPKSNSLPGHVLKALADTINETGKQNDVRVIVLKSEGEKTFCAGASFDELLSLENAVESKEFFMGFARVINAMRKCPTFIIARVQGKAVGGGVGVACAADYCLATDAAAVKLSELAVGIGPFVVGPAVARKMGQAAFSELAINASEWRSAAWAREKGMYYEVYQEVKQLDDAVAGLATRLSESSPDAMRRLKEVMWEGCEHWDTLLEARAEISGALILEDFARGIIQKFKQG
jgi:methylglutaconyl-CoA hydratase